MGLVLTVAWRNLWRRPGRTLLTTAAIALGLALLLVILGLNDGSHEQMIDAAVRLGSGHVLVQDPRYERRRGVDLFLPAPTLDAALAWIERHAGERRAVARRAHVSGLLSSADGATGVSVSGIEPDAERAASLWAARVVAGRFLADGDAGVAVVGSGVARLLAVRPGDRVVLMAQGVAGEEVRSALLRVVGVLHTGLEDVDLATALVPLPWLQAFLGLDGGAHQLALILPDHRRARAVADALVRDVPGVAALTWDEAAPQLAAAIRLDDGSNWVVNGIFFVLVAFMVLNTLLMSVLERRREFALLGALGVRPGRRRALVLAEASMLAALGAAGGLGLGLAVHAYFRARGLPLAWFTEETLEAAGVVLDPVIYSFLTPGRVASAVALVLALTVALGLVVARPASSPVDPELLKQR